jgi:hypothetical protein
MSTRVVEARYVGAYTIHIGFADGAEGDTDLSEELFGPVFEPLKDIEVFKQFSVHRELHTIVWPNGADFAPEFLREAIRVAV